MYINKYKFRAFKLYKQKFLNKSSLMVKEEINKFLCVFAN